MDNQLAALRLAAIVESSDDAIIGKTLEGIIVDWNRGAERLYGYTAAEIIGRPISLLIPEDRPDELPSIMNQLRQGKRIDHYETERVAKDGRRLNISVTISPIRDPSGRLVGASAIARDISERKRAEQERELLLARVSAARERLALLSEASKLLGSSLDYEATLRAVAGLALPILGDFGFFDVVEGNEQVRRIPYAHEDPARQALLETTHWVRSTRTDINLCALSSGASAVHPEITDAWLEDVATSPDHLALLRELGFRSMLTVPLAYQGRLLGALTLFYGASGRRYTPDDLALAEELARRAAAAVANATSFKQAQEAIRLRNDFLAVASHELRTPLTTIVMHAQLQLRQAERTGQLDYDRTVRSLKTIHQQGDRLARLILQLLDISRLEAGKLQLERQPTDLRQLAEEVVAAAQVRTDRHQITLDGPAQLSARVDPLRLDQVLTNLLDNAIKHSPEGGAIEVVLTPAAPDLIELSVCDHGPGIPPERRAGLFERFYQAHDGPQRGGLGLGLYISKEFVELHGGELRAEFPATGGSRFTVRIPTTANAEAPLPDD